MRTENFTVDTSLWDAWRSKVMEWKEKYSVMKEKREKSSERPSVLDPYFFINSISKLLPSDAIIVADCGGNIVITSQVFETQRGQIFITNNGNSPMGFSFCAAIGAWFACKGTRPVICIIGDGGFNMNIQELQTLVNYKVGITTIILNNHIYGITKAFQETNFEGRSEACGPKGYTPPNFPEVCASYLVNAFNISSSTRIDVLVKMCIDLSYLNTPTVFDVDCDEFHTYTPRVVGWNTSIEDMYPYLPREEYLSNLIGISPYPNYQTPAMPSIFNIQKTEENKS
jgi:acetolactate synthase-1/2/3 large subunit